MTQALDSLRVSFEDEDKGDWGALCQVEDGGLAGGSVRIGSRTHDVEDVVIGESGCDPLGVVRVQGRDESGSSGGHGG
jgi:hypothetical protein